MFPTTLILATDGSKDAELATVTAAGLAKGTSSELHVVHVSPPETLDDSSSSGNVAREEAENRGRAKLEQLVGEVEASGGEIEKSHFRMGRPDMEIVALAQELGAGLVVVGSRGLSPRKRALMGSVSESVVRHAHCSVLVVRRQDRRQDKSV